jgi:hypothetical protein
MGEMDKRREHRVSQCLKRGAHAGVNAVAAVPQAPSR